MRILLVEDGVKLGLSLQRGLEEELYAVDLIRDGDTAAIEAMVNEYDLNFGKFAKLFKIN
jgi:DNA-binding response OmpR family regulator